MIKLFLLAAYLKDGENARRSSKRQRDTSLMGKEGVGENTTESGSLCRMSLIV